MLCFNGKTFIIDPVVKKQNDRVITFENDISAHHRVSTTKHTASIMIIGVVASNWENMPPVWLERDYRLISAVYKDILETKVLSWDKKITVNSDYVFLQNRASDLN